MRASCQRVLGLAILCVGCGRSIPALPAASTTSSPTPTPNPNSNSCVGDLSEIDAATRVFPEALVRDGIPCGAYAYAEERHCPGVYVAVEEGDVFLFGRTRYFDGERHLFAMALFDHQPAFCGGTSFGKTYGTVLKCPTQEIVTDLCRR